MDELAGPLDEYIINMGGVEKTIRVDELAGPLDEYIINMSGVEKTIGKCELVASISQTTLVEGRGSHQIFLSWQLLNTRKLICIYLILIILSFGMS